MECQRCHTRNAAEARFCMKCGNSLSRLCSSCGAPLQAGAVFCSSCGHRAQAEAPELAAPSARERLEEYVPKELRAKLEAARRAGGMLGERRVVTMLFCDVKGSTAAAEKLDPEDWVEIMNGAFGHLIRPVYRYEGMLARLMGDAILAFFGAPIAHEDDPQRAILAGLEILRGAQRYRAEVRVRWGVDFDVRVGINTGLVVVGEVGTDLRLEYTAMGDAVNLAARMEQTAKPGTVQIAEATWKLVAPLFELEALDPIEVKGKSEPVRAWRALRPRAQPGSLRGVEGLASPLVGRDADLASLREAVEELRRGNGRVVSVVGEAGLGKSRLVAELRHGLAAEGALASAEAPSIVGDVVPLLWFEGRSLSYQTATPWAPFADLLARGLGLRADDSDADRYAMVRARLDALWPGQGGDFAPFLATVLSLEPVGDDAAKVRYLMPPQLRAGVSRVVRALLERLSLDAPVVLVLEDLHWADPSSLELAEQLMALTDRAAVMVLALFRPQHQDPSWRFHETAQREYAHRYCSVALQPLSGEQSGELLRNLLHVEDLPVRMREMILAKAEGNPFFVEEVIRSLLDAQAVVKDGERWRATREIERIAVPETLGAVLTARLDALPEETRRAAQSAAVVGREFDHEALVAAHGGDAGLDEALVELVRRGLVREKARRPVRVWSFKHGLTQEAAYGSLLLKTRRAVHLRVAEHFARVSHAPADTARHFLDAQEPVRALPHLLDAAEQAAKSFARTEAIAHYQRAVDIVQTVKDAKAARRAYEGLAGIWMVAMDPRAMEVYQRMLAHGKELGDGGMQTSALNKMSKVVFFGMGDLEQASEMLDGAEALARASGDLAGIAEASTVRCGLCSAQADFSGAEKHLQEAARIGKDLDSVETQLFGMTHTSVMRMYMTDWDASWKQAQETLALATKHGDLRTQAELKGYPIAWGLMRRGELGAAVREAEEAIAIAEKIGAVGEEAVATYTAGMLRQARGDYDAAAAQLDRCVAVARAGGVTYVEAVALCNLGNLWLDIDRLQLERTNGMHGQALGVLATPMGAYLAAVALVELGRCALEQGQLDAADGYFKKGLEAPSAPMFLVLPVLHAGRALVQRARGDLDAADASVAAAAASVTERGLRHHGPFVAYADGLVAEARGDAARASAAFERACEEGAAMGMRPVVWRAGARAAATLAAAGRGEEAAAWRARARAVAGDIAAGLADETTRARFQSTVEAALA